MASNEGQEAERSGKVASDKSGQAGNRQSGDQKGVQGSKAGVAKAKDGDWTQKLLKLSGAGEQGRC
ncbi:hypothetical protein M404DRAFT_35081 [Pisolithus tinctorius Marx 270]|uniref:Uncharacterized protein n=1 Tax=Pisolithus tinctorius Marx 270 TaxID=870435 RepID=A0A0C3IBG9_PISTI|nr:hypothetical protein M404DRAFT_35081 [Pisolithus tinctorius Marx 270]